jgi:biopolymer transport protein ExbB/TolQ
LIIGNKVSEGRLLCEESGGIISNIFRVALQELQKEPDMTQPVEDEIEVTRRVIDEELQVSVLPALEKHLNALDTLSRGTPLLGLLGTRMSRQFKLSRRSLPSMTTLLRPIATLAMSS